MPTYIFHFFFFCWLVLLWRTSSPVQAFVIPSFVVCLCPKLVVMNIYLNEVKRYTYVNLSTILSKTICQFPLHYFAADWMMLIEICLFCIWGFILIGNLNRQNGLSSWGRSNLTHYRDGIWIRLSSSFKIRGYKLSPKSPRPLRLDRDWIGVIRWTKIIYLIWIKITKMIRHNYFNLQVRFFLKLLTYLSKMIIMFFFNILC